MHLHKVVLYVGRLIYVVNTIAIWYKLVRHKCAAILHCSTSELWGKKKKRGVNENSPDLMLSKGNTTHIQARSDLRKLGMIMCHTDEDHIFWAVLYQLCCITREDVNSGNLRFCSAWRLSSGLLFGWVVFSAEVLKWVKVWVVRYQRLYSVINHWNSGVLSILFSYQMENTALYHLWGRKLILSQLKQGHLQFTTVSNLSLLWASVNILGFNLVCVWKQT